MKMLIYIQGAIISAGGKKTRIVIEHNLFPNFAYVVKVRRNENIIKVLFEMKKHGEEAKNKI